MKDLSFKVKYAIGPRKYEVPFAENAHFKIEYELTDETFKAKIISKGHITLESVEVSFPYAFAKGDKFFGNGYQSWTTSKEYVRSDKMRDITSIAVCKPLRNLAGISGDTRFVKVPKNAGEFYAHCYTYVKTADDYYFMGSLTERQGFTIIYADMNNNVITFAKDVEGVTVNKAEYDLFDMVMFHGTYDEIFDRYFGTMGLEKPRIDHMSGYTSWYNYFQKIDQNIILRDLNEIGAVKENVSIFQVDDGYETAVGDWLELNEEEFPNGMGFVAEMIHKKGYMAGIWLAPFNAQTSSKLLKEHKDWFIQGKHGFPEMGCPGWGGAATLDLYNKNAREYIKHVFDVVLNEWGYDMVKLDFLYSQCLTPRNNKSRGTIMCEAMEFLRECCGDKFILGCGVPLGAAFGYVDACRISCDVDLKYDGKIYNTLHINNEVPSAKNAITNSIFRRHLDGRAFCNDPDVFFLRYSNLKFTMEQKKLLAAVNHLCGNVLFVSDNAEEYKPEDIELIKKVFTKSEKTVTSASLDGNDGVICFTDNGVEKKLVFNLTTGESNVNEVLFND